MQRLRPNHVEPVPTNASMTGKRYRTAAAPQRPTGGERGMRARLGERYRSHTNVSAADLLTRYRQPHPSPAAAGRIGLMGREKAEARADFNRRARTAPRVRAVIASEGAPLASGKRSERSACALRSAHRRDRPAIQATGPPRPSRRSEFPSPSPQRKQPLPARRPRRAATLRPRSSYPKPLSCRRMLVRDMPRPCPPAY